MRNAIKSPSTWILLLALILLAICVLWLLPRLLEPPPAPATNIAASEAPPRTETGLVGSGTHPATLPAGGDPSGDSSEVRKDVPVEEKAARGSAESSMASGRISGRVVNQAGHGVAGATVFAAHALDIGTPIEPSSWWIAHLPLDVADPVRLGAEAPTRTTTVEDGSFSFEDFEPGRVRLAVRSEANDPIDLEDLWLPSRGELSLPKLRAERAPLLAGRVFAPDGVPIPEAAVVRVDDLGQAGLPRLSARAGVLLAATDGRGYFRTIPASAGPWSVVITQGKDFADLEVEQAAGSRESSFEATLVEAAVIRGRVRTGSPFLRPMVVRALPAAHPRSGAASIPFSCRIDARTAEVRANGDFELAGLQPGAVYELRASESQRPWEVDSSWSPPALFAAGERRAEVLWDPDASVAFRIVAAGTRQSLSDCRATFEGVHPEAVQVAAATGATSGLSTIEGLRPKRLSSFRGLVLSKEGFLDVELGLEDLRPGRTHSLGDVELVPVPTILVRAVDAATERPIEDAEVRAVETPVELGDPDHSSGTRTDAQGLARVRSFGGAGSGIEVHAPGYAPARRRGPFGSGFAEASLTIGLLRGATARVRVVDAAGDPMRVARIEHVEGSWSPNESWAEAEPRAIGRRPASLTSRVADERGVARFDHLAPGRHAFRIQRYRAYEDSEWTLRELAEGDSDEIVLVGKAPTRLDVHVHDAGQVVAGGRAALLRPEDYGEIVPLLDPRTPLPPCRTAILDDRGEARFSNLEPGRYLLLVGVPGQGLRASWEVKVAAGGSRAEIDLSQRSIVGAVAHAESGLLPGAEISIATWGTVESRRDASKLLVFGYAGPTETFASGLEIPATLAGDDGTYRIVGLPQGIPWFVVARYGEHWRGAMGPATAGAGTRVDLAVEAAGAIEVRIAEGSRIFPCTLAAYPEDRRSRPPPVVRTFSGGIEMLTGIRPGRWGLMVVAEGRWNGRAEAEVVAGETAVVEIALR